MLVYKTTNWKTTNDRFLNVITQEMIQVCQKLDLEQHTKCEGF